MMGADAQITLSVLRYFVLSHLILKVPTQLDFVANLENKRFLIFARGCKVKIEFYNPPLVLPRSEGLLAGEMHKFRQPSSGITTPYFYQ